ncbi:MarR family winged helix-turn-helix transcriptional regulator [Erythrobacter oryzae]|uniref:MarR family winged helix-turn-helix transcriptional regulator n=1 Tax=Erythrobacter oryzae TaxID=3019556 RepID=UPI0025552211|nr:MarR family transcriptional regulator [Erythrobacter sp. COR-2]
MTDPDNIRFLMALTRAYHLLDRISDKLHAGHGLSAGARSILLLLDRHGALTLSEIARDRAVSRQLIQRLAAPLITAGFIATDPKTTSRRSPKLVLTPQGRAAVAGIVAREATIAARVAEAISADEREQAQAVLEKLNAVLSELKAGGAEAR